MKKDKRQPFRFKQFSIADDMCAMKVGTDGVLLGAWAKTESAKRILDIGTGSGLIAIMSAQKNKTAEITGIEIEKNAAMQAQENCRISPWNNRLEIIHIPLQDYFVSEEEKFDYIISNPPFFNTYNSAIKNNRNIARQTDFLSQDDLIKGISELLSQDGKCAIILPHEEGMDFIEKLITNGFFIQRLTEVHPKKNKKIERILIEFSKCKSTLEKNKLIIQHEKRNDWTADYIKLTHEFYLKMKI